MPDTEQPEPRYDFARESFEAQQHSRRYHVDDHDGPRAYARRDPDDDDDETED